MCDALSTASIGVCVDGSIPVSVADFGRIGLPAGGEVRTISVPGNYGNVSSASIITTTAVLHQAQHPSRTSTPTHASIIMLLGRRELLSAI